MKLKHRSNYAVFGRDRGNTKAKPRYLFTVVAYNKTEARKQARNRVKGAYTITKVVFKI